MFCHSFCSVGGRGCGSGVKSLVLWCQTWKCVKGVYLTWQDLGCPGLDPGGGLRLAHIWVLISPLKADSFTAWCVRGFNNTALNVRVNEQKSLRLQLINVQPVHVNPEVSTFFGRFLQQKWKLKPRNPSFCPLSVLPVMHKIPHNDCCWFSRLPVEREAWKCWTHNVGRSCWLQPAGLERHR